MEVHQSLDAKLAKAHLQAWLNFYFDTSIGGLFSRSDVDKDEVMKQDLTHSCRIITLKFPGDPIT